jgi:hypothetical protein
VSLFKLDKSYFDTFKILAKPKRFFSSSSSGITGSLPVFPGASIAMKEVTTSTSDTLVDEGSIEALRKDACKLDVSGSEKYALVDEYMSMANAENANIRRTKKMEVLRFEPSVRFTSDTIRKSIIKDSLFPFYKVKYGKACNWAVTNYNTLNFFSTVDDTVPDNTVLMYPASGSYTYRPTGSFSFEFYLNPRYHEVGRGMAFGAGTIFHMSSSYALSLITGSAKDNDGLVDGYRLLLQLSHSADLLPSQCPIGLTGAQTDPHDFIFSSSDNSLRKNHWHHCCVRWDNNTQNSTGSFVVDGATAGTFCIPDAALSGSYLQRELPTTTLRGAVSYAAGPPDVLFIGNFYDGPNSIDPGGDEDFTAQFFNPVTAYADGITNYYAPSFTHDSPGPITEPDDFTFAHPLNAEVHELKIYDRYRTDADIATARISGPDSLTSEKAAGLLFYVPPFFTKDTNTRNVLQTPFQTARGSTDDPFSVPLSFGVGGHYLNLENFVKELVLGKFPRLYNLSASTIDTQTGWSTANNYLFTTGSVRKRNLTILPNDNGLFIPNFSILEQAAANTGSLSLFTRDDGTKDLSLINLSVLIPTASIGAGLLGTETPGSISEALQGASPDDPSVPAGSILTIYNRTRDPSSNEISIFDACNLFYGNKIDPGTYVLKDTSVTGSGGRISITTRDHTGSLYRADALTPTAKWSSIGTVLYEEGISVVKTPLIPRFGADQFSVDLFGQQNIHMLRIDIPAERGDLDLSTNPSYTKLSPTDQSADKDVRFSYITNVNLLDENLNVISKANFSQAIIKRENDRFIIRIKLDF